MTETFTITHSTYTNGEYSDLPAVDAPPITSVMITALRTVCQKYCARDEPITWWHVETTDRDSKPWATVDELRHTGQGEDVTRLSDLLSWCAQQTNDSRSYWAITSEGTA